LSGRPSVDPYPAARRADLIDDFHGVRVADPYRWLEDADAPETVAWVEAQNALTRSALDGPAREALVEKLTSLYDYSRISVPVKRGGRYFFTFNEGLRNQPILYVMDGADEAPRRLVDPNKLGADGTVALTSVVPSDDGALVAYALSRSGSDRQDVHIRNVATGTDLPERLEWLKFATIAWMSDASGLYYTRFPRPGAVPPGDEHYFPVVCYHRLGDPQEQDAVVFGPPSDREIVYSVDLTNDDRWIVITSFKGASDRSAIHLIDRTRPGSAPVQLFAGFQHAYTFIGDRGGTLFFLTDVDAPNGRIIGIGDSPLFHADSSGLSPRPTLKERWGAEKGTVPESPDKLTTAVVAGGMIVTCHLHNASDRLSVYDLTGAPRGTIALPGLGSVTGLSGHPDDDEVLVGFWSFTHPPASYRVLPASMRSLERFVPDLPAARNVSIEDNGYVTRQVWVTSKDGTRVSMFLVHRADLPQDGNRPALLNGYGGFNVNLTPMFDPANFVLLERGGIFAQAQLRGGGEYGERWHQAGMLERKQNVFDDFIAAAEWLIASGYTSPARLAIEGGSNGGLLTSAVVLQRPELFGAVVCRVPVADMLRYHRFTIGRFWIPEYGNAEDPAQFEFLYKYSPYHNVRPGANYPPMLITTADTDDRVSPGMAKKLAARLQAEASGRTTGPTPSGPFLIRVETRAGHGLGKPVSKMIQEDADIFAFLFKYLEVP
jgi:prolyl oligopeptidase